MKIELQLCLICLACSLTGCTKPSQDTALLHEERFRRLWIAAITPAQGDEAPASLQDLVSRIPDANEFCCPDHSAARPRDNSLVNVWTDFIYVGGLRNYDGDVAILICPAENHQNRAGFALLASGRFVELSSQQAQEMVATPWLLTEHLSPGALHVLTNHINIHIPPALRPKH